MERHGRHRSASPVRPVAKELDRLGLAYLHIIEPRMKGYVVVAEGQAPAAAEHLRTLFIGRIVATGGFEPEMAAALVEKGDADLVAFGRHLISNPDLPERVRKSLTLSRYDWDTLYTFEAEGYTDYAASSAAT